MGNAALFSWIFYACDKREKGLFEARRVLEELIIFGILLSCDNACKK